MPTLIRKVQVLVDERQHRALLALARAQGKPLSVLLREAIVEQLLKQARRTARQKAFEEIVAMDLPVADWSQMEKEIERSHARGQRRR